MASRGNGSHPGGELDDMWESGPSQVRYIAAPQWLITDVLAPHLSYGTVAYLAWVCQNPRLLVRSAEQATAQPLCPWSLGWGSLPLPILGGIGQLAAKCSKLSHMEQHDTVLAWPVESMYTG